MKVRKCRGKKDFKSALEECRKGLDAFPNSIDMLYTYSELKIISFNQERNPDHLKNALISFEKLLKINPHHYMANLNSAKIYFKAKAVDRAESKLDVILKANPKDPKALEIKRAIRKFKAPEKTAKKSAEKAAPQKVEIEDTEKVDTEKMAGLLSGASEEHEKLIKKLAPFTKMDGFISIHLIDPAGVSLKTINKPGITSNEIASFIGDVFRTSGLCTTKMGLGNFQKGQIITKKGIIVIVNVFYAILALVMEPEVNIKTMESRVDRYIQDLV